MNNGICITDFSIPVSGGDFGSVRAGMPDQVQSFKKLVIAGMFSGILRLGRSEVCPAFDGFHGGELCLWTAFGTGKVTKDCTGDFGHLQCGNPVFL